MDEKFKNKNQYFVKQYCLTENCMACKLFKGQKWYNCIYLDLKQELRK